MVFFLNPISGVLVLPPANPPERTHLPSVQSEKPVSEPEKTQKEAGRMKNVKAKKQKIKTPAKKAHHSTPTSSPLLSGRTVQVIGVPTLECSSVLV